MQLLQLKGLHQYPLFFELPNETRKIDLLNELKSLNLSYYNVIRIFVLQVEILHAEIETNGINEYLYAQQQGILSVNKSLIFSSIQEGLAEITLSNKCKIYKVSELTCL